MISGDMDIRIYELNGTFPLSPRIPPPTSPLPSDIFLLFFLFGYQLELSAGYLFSNMPCHCIYALAFNYLHTVLHKDYSGRSFPLSILGIQGIWVDTYRGISNRKTWQEWHDRISETEAWCCGKKGWSLIFAWRYWVWHIFVYTESPLLSMESLTA